MILNDFESVTCFPVFSAISKISAGDFGKDQGAQEKIQDQAARQLFGGYKYHKTIAQHGNEFKIINGDTIDQYHECDALIWYRTKSKEQGPLFISPTADCPTVVLHVKDHLSEAIAIIHSGRRGTKLGIVPKIIETIANHLCIKPSLISTELYPGICENCYEVTEDIAKNFPPEFVNDRHLNLRGIITEQLVSSGVEKMIISSSCSCCTKENGEHIFYSHRRNPNGKRNAVFITPFKLG
jgi:copper oxidase (laccase) domain-containing protein